MAATLESFSYRGDRRFQRKLFGDTYPKSFSKKKKKKKNRERRVSKESPTVVIAPGLLRIIMR